MPELQTAQQPTEADAIAGLAATPFVETIHGVPIIMLPSGNGQWTADEQANLLPAPTRKTGNIKTHNTDSFIDVAKRFGSLATCNIYLDVDYAAQRVQATAVFNDHADGDGDAGWRDHRATFAPRQTEEWKRWTGKDRQVMEQVKLAHFLEENIGDIASADGMPSGSDVLTFVSHLEETRKVKYGSAVNLQNGMVQIEFVEDSGDKTTTGKLEMFREFALGLRPFDGGDAYQVKAFLRYRIDRNTGQIVFWFELQRPDRVLEDASKAMVDKIKTSTGLPVIFGTPE